MSNRVSQRLWVCNVFAFGSRSFGPRPRGVAGGYIGRMPSATGGIPEEFQQMMREMNRRVESLEGRIDELVDARDRLERQVGAHTEELRVQRAAIARTQRAVRNLARPEDEDGEQELTEPALRDPNATS